MRGIWRKGGLVSPQHPHIFCALSLNSEPGTGYERAERQSKATLTLTWLVRLSVFSAVPWHLTFSAPDFSTLPV